MEYFNRRQFRADKNVINIPSLKINGVNFRELVWNNLISVNDILAEDMYLEILTNKRKPLPPGYKADMPNDIARSSDIDFKIERLRINNMIIAIKELWPYSDNLTELKFTNTNCLISNISNKKNAVMNINASSYLANAGLLEIDMKIPLLTKQVNFSYEGSLSKMEAEKLNSHLNISDLTKINSGIIESVTFTVKAEDDIVSANVVPVYNDLEIKVLDEETIGEGGIKEKVETFIAREFVIRKSNPDDEGKIKSGNVIYTRQKTDAFLDMVWLSLRKAIAEVVGF
jgi:hypothetical protein